MKFCLIFGFFLCLFVCLMIGYFDYWLIDYLKEFRMVNKQTVNVLKCQITKSHKETGVFFCSTVVNVNGSNIPSKLHHSFFSDLSVIFSIHKNVQISSIRPQTSRFKLIPSQYLPSSLPFPSNSNSWPHTMWVQDIIQLYCI